MVERRIPVQWLKSAGTGPPEQRRAQPPQGFHLLAAQFGQIVNGVLENQRRNGRLDIGGLGLHRLVADRREFAQLIGHAALLAAHAIGAGLAGVLGGQRLGSLPHPDPVDGREGVENLLGSPAHDVAGIGQIISPRPIVRQRRALGQGKCAISSTLSSGAPNRSCVSRSTPSAHTWRCLRQPASAGQQKPAAR